MSSSEDNTNTGGNNGGSHGGNDGHGDPNADGLTFAKRLGAEPRQVAADVRAATRDGKAVDPEQLAAVEAAESLERGIEGTLRAPAVPAGLVDELLAIPDQAKVRRGPPSWLALAASVFLIVGVSSVVWLNVNDGNQTVAQYVEAHFHHDGEAVLAMAEQGTDPAQVAAVMASLGATASDELMGRIQFIKFCPTPDSQGAHMVISTADGPATVIFMPAVTVEEPLFLSFDGVDAKVIGLDAGSAAIIGAGENAAQELRASLEAGIQPMKADT